MMPSLVAAVAALFVATSLSVPRSPQVRLVQAVPAPGPLTPAERAELVASLRASRATFLASIEGLSEAQWMFKPSPARWSIAETAEHIVLVDRGISNILYNRLATSAAVTPDTAADRLTARIKGFMADRTQKATAPEGFGPSGTWADERATLAAYAIIRNNLAAFIDSTDAPLRYNAVRHPSFGPMDGYQWLVMLAGHSDRHVQQIEEVKRAAGYPAAP